MKVKITRSPGKKNIEDNLSKTNSVGDVLEVL